MTHHRPLRRPLAGLAIAAAPLALAATAFAQEPTAAPPPVTPTVTQTAPAPSPTPSAQTPPPSRETGRPVEANTTNPASRTTIAPGAGDVVDDARARPAQRTTATRAERPAATRTTTTTTTTTTAPATAAPAPPTAAPIAVAPPAATVATPPPDTAAATTTTTTATDEAPAVEDGDNSLLWLGLVVLVVLGGIGLFAWSRKRSNDAFVDRYSSDHVYPDAHVEPAPQPVATPEPYPAVVPVAAVAVPAAVAAAGSRHDPVAGALADPAPVVAEDATVTAAEAEEVAALTDAAPPIADRPWLEFAMRPVRAGTNVDEALVEIELTVANAGNLPAEDVRVSTFMLTDAHASEIERLTVDPPADAAVEAVTIQPGEGTRIDATLAALKADLGGEGGFTPVVVADARYRLPDGSEGRTSASFVVGVAGSDGTIAPIDLDTREMHDDVEARLHGEPQRI